MRKAFSLTELMIVVAILGILAAIALPTLQGHVTEAKEAAAKDNLRILRNAIEVYAARHNGVPPGYPNDDPTRSPGGLYFIARLANGHYLNKIPPNPFNESRVVCTVQPRGGEPVEATGSYGWIYNPAAKTIRLDWPGKDKTGIRYYDY